jgi:hypothetical protein
VKIVGEMEIFSFSSSSLRSLVERRELLELGEKMNLAVNIIEGNRISSSGVQIPASSDRNGGVNGNERDDNAVVNKLVNSISRTRYLEDISSS